jgi:hypothetical protein
MVGRANSSAAKVVQLLRRLVLDDISALAIVPRRGSVA